MIYPLPYEDLMLPQHFSSKVPVLELMMNILAFILIQYNWHKINNGLV